ncbi:hypothetical protein CEE37_13605 [candidate division LCP-89 bacterium B3_LCP]|uniref:Gingipain R n=1 Tax=candidate division LCP-89 bacterium B3_LCP TaxID=2012998 RepID=A0A532UST7_UNCL8|nr:MAG: hypothetical protein CEE37_13605 [candidate division LCP-89 bacterium B3_LCP]
MNRKNGKTKPQKLGLTIILGLVLAFATSTSYAAEISFENNWAENGFNLMNQNASGVEIIFSVTDMQILDMMIAGELMQKINIPGVLLPNDAGAPDLPGTGRFIAIPEGATAELEIVEYRTEVMHGLNLVPAFEIPLENDDSPLKYQKNPEIYGANANYPQNPVLLSEVTEIRGVDIVTVGVTPFQYNPITQDLIVYTDILVRVNFHGGNGHFGEDRLRSRWWEPVLRQNIFNYQSLPEVEFHRNSQTDETNVEYIIITPDDPEFVAWADTLKQWRNEQGIRTDVVTLSEIGGNNSTAIQTYITTAYYQWDIPPVAVLLLSDYEWSGDTYGITAPSFGSCVSDNFYADVNGDQLPDLAIGRICAQNNTHLQNTISKMLEYERYPYTDPNFYDQPLIAGGWQTERWFILCCEVIYGYMANVHDKRPARQYALYSGYPSGSWSSNSNTWMVVNYFGPTGLGYIPATPDHLTNWGGNAAGINNAINSGAFIVQHRDHGSVTGWGEPDYQIYDMNGLNNDMYPYVFSINCSTGKFNSGSECFAEAFHRYPNRALGVLAASATSYSFVNDTFVWGIYDSMWPDFDPGYGADPYGEDNLRPAFGNASGKYYLQASSWPSNPGSKSVTYYLFHHHGDAFMTLYSEIPENLTVSHGSTVSTSATTFSVTADDASLIGLSQMGSVVGSAEGTGSAVDVTLSTLIPGVPMLVTVTKANYYRYTGEVTVEGTPPDIVVTLTPDGTPIQIPVSGGSFDYNIEGTNNGSSAVTADIWCDVTLPNGTTFGPTVGPVGDYTFAGSSSVNRDRTQSVPGGAPEGTYTYNAYIGVYPDYTFTEDHFDFEKLSSGDGDWVETWQNTGELFENWVSASEEIVPETHLLSQNFPNPFNPSTVISYQLPGANLVHLAVYDLSGRKVADLVNGWRDAGVHEVTFDASDLSSGIYLYRVEAGDFSTTGKMVLMK